MCLSYAPVRFIARKAVLCYLCINCLVMLDTIESAIEDIKNGKLVIVVDDEDR